MFSDFDIYLDSELYIVWLGIHHFRPQKKDWRGAYAQQLPRQYPLSGFCCYKFRCG